MSEKPWMAEMAIDQVGTVIVRSDHSARAIVLAFLFRIRRDADPFGPFARSSLVVDHEGSPALLNFSQAC